MIEYEIEHLNNRYEELENKLRNAAFALLRVDPVSWHIDVDIHGHRAFDIEFKVYMPGTTTGETKCIPAEVIDKFYEVNLDAAMRRWDEIKEQREADRHLSDELHKSIDFIGQG